MTLPDFDSYCAVKDSVLNAYEDRMSWANKMVINIAKAGCFSSDRTIAILFRSVDGCFRLLTRSSPLKIYREKVTDRPSKYKKVPNRMHIADPFAEPVKNSPHRIHQTSDEQ